MRARSKAILVLATMLALGCSQGKRTAKVLSQAQKQMDAGDSAFLAREWDQAQQAYQEADRLLGKLGGTIRKDLEPRAAALRRDVDLRCGIFKGPEECVVAAVRLAGTGEHDDLASLFWDAERLCKRALGTDRWEALSPGSRSHLIEVSEAFIFSRVGLNRPFYAKVNIAFSEREIEEDRSVLLGMWTFGESRSLVRVEMAREGKIWRVEDAYFGLFGAAMSTVLSESLQYLEALRPIQETLSRQDSREVLEEAFEIAADEISAQAPGKGKIAFVKTDTVFTKENGETLSLKRNSLVEVLGDRRSVDHGVEIRIRPILLGRERADGQVVDQTQAGWVPEGALPSTDASAVWGME